MNEIHQLLPNLDYGDAISQYSLALRDSLREWGYESDIFAQYLHPRMVHEGIFYKNHESRLSSQHGLIYHYSIGSEITEYFAKSAGKKMLFYHNITPPEFFTPFDQEKVRLLEKGRHDLSSLVSVPQVSLADSSFNACQLDKLGFKNVNLQPIIFDFDQLDQSPNPTILNQYRNTDMANILFVGRIAPNKKLEDILRAFYFYKKVINKHSRLFLAGPFEFSERYYWSLIRLIENLEIEDVHFTGRIEFGDLLAYYHIADLFLCMSEHEGFCIPLVEAMKFRIPILAFRSSAVPETLDGTGIVFNEKRFEWVAELMGMLITDSSLKERIVQNQARRLKAFSPDRTKTIFKRYIQQWEEM